LGLCIDSIQLAGLPEGGAPPIGVLVKKTYRLKHPRHSYAAYQDGRSEAMQLNRKPCNYNREDFGLVDK
jgi:hypothetical protein